MESKNKKIVNMDLKQYGMVLILIGIVLLFALTTSGANAKPVNINNLIMQNGYVVILAIGMLLCVLTGNIDLGVGSVVAVCGSFAGIIMMDLKMNMWVAIIAALLVGLLTGVFAGFFIAYLGIPPFVTTLATMLMGRGLTYTMLKAQTKGPTPQAYNWIGAGFLPSIKMGKTAFLCKYYIVRIGIWFRMCYKNKYVRNVADNIWCCMFQMGKEYFYRFD